MIRTGTLALGAILLALAFAPQASATVGVAGVHHVAASQVQQIGLKKKHHHHHGAKKHKKHHHHHKSHKKHH
jgi:UDP-N-acetylmuramyl pentapeptide phosphotransferase/UDP-N-acetylglucosamine-1-phosphate transferase